MPKIKSIKYIGKKDTYNIEMSSKYHNYLLGGCVSKNSHSIAYSIIGYQCAYLKANYPNEYYCALLNNSIDNDDKKNKYISDCFDKGISVCPPNINHSGVEFELDDNRNIVFPMSAIKGVGANTVKKIIDNRNKYGKFKSFIDFIHRCMPDKTTIVSLIETNAFVDIEPQSKRWLDNIEELCEAIADYKKDKKNKILYENNCEYGGLIFDKITKRLIKTNVNIEKLKNDKKQIKGASKQNKADKEDIDKLIELEINKIRQQVISNFINNHSQLIKVEMRDNEIKYLSYQLTTNPSFLFNKYVKHFKDVQQGKIKYLFKTVDNITKEDIGSYIATVGEIKTLREVIIKNGKDRGKKMAFSTVKYADKEFNITFFNSIYEDLTIKQGDFILCYGQVKEGNNKEFSDIDFIANKCNILNCITTEEDIILDITNLDDKKRNTLIKGILTKLQEECYDNSQDINYIFKVMDNGKEITAPMYRWINNKERFYDLVNTYEVY